LKAKPAGGQPAGAPNAPSAMYYTTGTNVTFPATLPTHALILRRLACPYLPPNPTPGANYNPYITVDYVDNLPVNDGVQYDQAGVHAAMTAITSRQSFGRTQPFAAFIAEQVGQNPQSHAGLPLQTLFQHNAVEAAAPPSAATAGQTLTIPFDWLPHLDRQVVSPLELLQVSGYKPHELTQQFINRDASNNRIKFAHQVNWFNQTNRLYRVFELLETKNRAAGMTVGGRTPGKVNINTIWDPETFLALCDPQTSNNFTLAQLYNSGNPYDPATIFGQLINLRSPGLAQPTPTLTANDQPFLGMAAPYTASGDTQYPNGAGIDNTFLRNDPTNNRRLFEVPGATHPYQKYQLMAKLYNNLTTRSNVFALWLTVGFFEVTQDVQLNAAGQPVLDSQGNPIPLQPPKLGKEIGLDLAQNVRHHMFAVVDRTALTAVTASTPSTTSGTAVSSPGSQTITPNGITSVTTTPIASLNGNGWSIQAGTILMVDTSPNQETVVVTAVDTTNQNFTAKFNKTHTTTPFTIYFPQSANPGPQATFDVRDNSAVVPFFVIID
jgi:hypothetical protein